MKQKTQLFLLIKTFEPDTPVIVTWRDAVDYSDEVTLSTLVIKEVLYDTIGFFLKIMDDYVVLAYNRENDNETYKGVGIIPCSLITDIRRLSDGYDE
jgi:hypothetical protein|tara:strand:+ start:269 stop:559 length:291 start_codon:yes stop_codon:yes gene_type:complete